MQITGFRSESQELVLDVDQLPGAVAVNRESGQLALRPELANGTDGASVPVSLPAEKVVDVHSVSQDDGRVEVKIDFHAVDGSSVITLSLGTTDQVDAARSWIDEVKAAVGKRERASLNPTIDGESAVTPPATAPEAADAVAQVQDAPAEPVEVPTELPQSNPTIPVEPAVAVPSIVSTPPAAVTMAAEAAPVPVADEPVEVVPERRPRLNPTVDLGSAVAVPSIIPTPPPPVPEGVEPAPVPVPVPVAPPGPPAEPVELPPERMAIDTDLEKELEAAMAGQMTAPTTPPAGAVAVTHTAQTTVSEMPESEEQLEPGTKLKAKVQTVTPDNVFCDVGFRSPGLLPARQFPQGKQPRIGEEFLVVVEKYDTENSVILVNLPKATRRAKGNWEELTVGQVVECMVTKTNKGGLEVNIGPLRAFLPASQVDLGFAPVLESYVGKKLAVQITEVNPAKRNLVVSRRVILIEERKELAVNFWQNAEVGQQYSGTVKTIKDYGAFIDLGGADGFLHIGEMSWTRVKHPSEVLQEGGQVDVVVLSLDREKQKIGLGMRQLAHNPWAGVEDRYPTGKNVSGRVTRISDFGAFVELESGVEGLIHISELDHQRVRKVSDVVNVGQEVSLQVIEVLPDRQRISLSLKALKQKPEKPKDEDLSPSQGQQYERKRKEPLRGGTSREGGGGLFGNPGDFKKQ